MPFLTTFRLATFLVVVLPACTRGEGQRVAAHNDTTAVATAPQAAPTKADDDALIARADSGRIAGAATAPVWVLEVSDFQCPYCKTWHDKTYPVLRDEYIKTGKIRFAFVNLPLAFHERAAPAAIAAMCASAQGKFWPMQESLFANQRTWSQAEDPMPQLEQLAKNAGVNVEEWRNCTRNKRILDMINADKDRVARAGARATPSFLVNGKLIEGAVPIEPLRQAINAALAAPKAK